MRLRGTDICLLIHNDIMEKKEVTCPETMWRQAAAHRLCAGGRVELPNVSHRMDEKAVLSCSAAGSAF